MDVRQLRYFIAIAEVGSVSRAAERLGVAQPSLSQQIRAMEMHFGVTLLRRTPRGVVPTEAGLRLVERGRTILGQFAELRAAVVDGVDAPAGEVRFGMPTSTVSVLSVPLIEAARSRLPAVRIHIVEAMSQILFDGMRRGEVDLAILSEPPHCQGLVMHPLVSEPLHLFGTPAMMAQHADGPVPMETLLELPLILPGRPNGLRVLLEETAAAMRRSLRPVLEMNSQSQIKLLVRRGHGLSVLPLASLQQEVAAGGIMTAGIGTPPLCRPIFLAHVAGVPLTRRSEAVADLAWNCVRDLVRRGAWPAQWVDEGARCFGEASQSRLREAPDATRHRTLYPVNT